MPRVRPSFDAWFADVNRRIVAACGLSSDDLPDCTYADWHEDGVSAATAARRAIKNAGG